MYQSQEINELMLALSKAQGEVMGAIKDSSNPFFKSKYADLNSVWNACRAPLSKNGLAIVQTMNQFEGDMHLVTTLGHSSGQWMKSTLPLKMSSDKVANPIQALGSSITYLRRYALAAMVGVAPDEDDDGNEGGKTYRNEPKPQQKSAPIKADLAKVDRAEADQLKEVLQECSPEYQARIDSFLTKQNIDLYNLPIETYVKIKSAATCDRDKYIQQSQQQIYANLPVEQVAK